MVNNDHNVVINFGNETEILNSLNGVSAKIYTINGYYVNTSYPDSKGNIHFKLPLGHYTVVVLKYSTQYSFNVYIYNDTVITKRLPIFPTNEPVDILKINAYYDGIQIFDAKIILIDINGKILEVGLINNSYQIEKIPKQKFLLRATRGVLTEELEFDYSSNLELNINFTHKVHLQMKTTSSNEINDFSCFVYDLNNLHSSYKENCSEEFYLPKSVYNFTFINTIYGKSSITTIVGNESKTQPIIKTVGLIQTNFTFYVENGVVYNSSPVFSKSINDQTYILEGITTSEGKLQINYDYESEHIFYINTSLAHNTFYYKSTQNENKTIILQNSKQLTISVNNGSEISLRPILNANIILTTNNKTNYFGSTSIDGKKEFIIKTEDILNVTVSTEHYTKNFLINSFNNGDIINYTLGKNLISFLVSSESGIPINNINLTDISTINNKTQLTDISGNARFEFDTLSIKPNLENISLLNQIVSIKENLNLNYLKTNYYVFIMEYNLISKMILVPKTFMSSFTQIELKIPYHFIINLRLYDNSQADVPGASVSLTSKITNTTLTKFTNNEGKITTEIDSIGVFYVLIQLSGEQYSDQINASLSQVLYEINLPVLVKEVNVNVLYFHTTYTSVSSKEYLNYFYESTITFFIQIMLVLLFVVIIVLVFLFSSAILLIIESIQSEIAIIQIFGGSNNQILLNVLTQLSIRAFFSTIVGYYIGFLATIYFPSLNQIQLIGFIIKPEFNFEIFLFSILIINILSIGTLIKELKNYDWKTPIKNVKF
jgi:hypothetical protein